MHTNLIIAHRGYSDKYGDNNMQSFYEAVRAGFDMIELDVQYCSSGEPVIYHDIDVDNCYIRDLSSETLFSKYNIITLEKFFSEFAQCNIKFFLDIKGDEGVIEPVLELVRKWIPFERRETIFISGFNRYIVDFLSVSDCGVQIGFTTENRFRHDELAYLTNGCQFVCLHWNALNNDSIAYFKQHNVLVFSYTCKNYFIESHMKQFDIDGIVTNYLL